MQLRAKPESAQLICTADGANAVHTIILDCSPSDSDDVLEIGDGHVFTSKDNRSRFNKRKSCDLRVWLKWRDTLEPEGLVKLNLSESKIGELGFYPASKAGDFYPAQPATLEATLFICDELHERLLDAFQAGKRASSLTMEIEKKGVLKFGWEPDGSRLVWKIENPSEPSYVDVGGISIAIELFG